MAYTPEQIESTKEVILERMLNGKSLKSILDSDKELPNRTTVYKWLNEENDLFDKEFLNNYTRATQDRADFLVEEILTIADDQTADVYIDDEGKEHVNHNVINRSKLMVDSRKWIAGKMKPKKYGDKNTTVLEGGDKPIAINAIFSTDLLNVPTNNSIKEDSETE